MSGLAFCPEVIKANLLKVVDQATQGMVVSREQEGAKMAELIEQRLVSMSKVIDEVVNFLPDITANYRTRLEDKLAEIKDQLDPSRLEQEMVIFFTKNGCCRRA